MASSRTRKKPATEAALTAAAPGGSRRYRIGDFPMHYFAAIQRQNQINLGHALRANGVSVPTWRALSALDDDAKLTIGQLAELTVLDRSSLGRLLEELAAAGLVSREPAPDDRRAFLVRRTAAGKRAFEAALPIVHEHYRRLLRGVSEEEFNVLMRLLRRLKGNALMMSDVGTSAEN
jgi:DNA-binding MarR family transcriptional regulator